VCASSPAPASGRCARAFELGLGALWLSFALAKLTPGPGSSGLLLGLVAVGAVLETFVGASLVAVGGRWMLGVAAALPLVLVVGHAIAAHAVPGGECGCLGVLRLPDGARLGVLGGLAAATGLVGLRGYQRETA